MVRRAACRGGVHGSCGVGTVGIDLGLNSLIATSDGETVEMLRFAQRAQEAQRRCQRALARCRRGSKRRLKAKERQAAASARIARQRRDHLHKLWRSSVSRFWGIAFEDLDMARLTKGMLARSVLDAAWSLLVQLTAKLKAPMRLSCRSIHAVLLRPAPHPSVR